MAERGAQLAVASMKDYLDANLVTKLRAVETDLSLTSGDLVDPVDIVQAFLPWDNRSPLVQVFDEDAERVDPKEPNYWAVEVLVVLSYNGGTDVEAGEVFARRYMRAIDECISDDFTLSNTVIGTEITDFTREFAAIDDSSTRHFRALGTTISVC